MRGGVGRTRTNHQSVMEHRSCPTNYPGRTPIQIVGRFVVLFDFPGFLILHQPPERYGTWFESDQVPWSDSRRPFLGQVAFALPRRSGWVSDQGSWSDTTIFHNTLCWFESDQLHHPVACNRRIPV